MADARTFRLVTAVLLGLFWAAAAAGQDIDEQDPLLRPIGDWHAAVSLQEMIGEGEIGPAEVLRAAQSELALGRPGRALSILSDYPVPDSAFAGAPLRVFATALYDKGRYGLAAQVFVRATRFASGTRRGVLTARAADAFERDGMHALAASRYRAAAQDLPALAGWLALREARVTRDTAAAFALLEAVPQAGRELALQTRAQLLMASGDTAGTVQVLGDMGRFLEGAQLALSFGSVFHGRWLAYEALAAADERDRVRETVDFVLEAFPPETPEEQRAVGRALVSAGRPREAIPLIDAAVVAGDSTPATLLLLGESRAAARDRLGAVAAYQRVAQGNSPQAAEAAFERARLLDRLRRRTAATEAYRSVVDRFPADPQAPAAAYQIAAISQRLGRLQEADSVFAIVADRWPTDRYASWARFRLASHARRRGDVDAAIAWYRAEVKWDGHQAPVARFQMAQLLGKRGDTAAAVQEWIDLARTDSVGYYGTVARQRAQLPPLAFAPRPPAEPTWRIRKVLSGLDLLNAAGFDAEAEALVSYLAESESLDADEVLDLAEGLIARGRTRQGIRLGWRAAGERGLNDPRVVRVIFPWPNQVLVEREANKFGLDPYLVAAVIRQESAFDPGATSRAGARGLMQLMPSTATWVARQLGVEWGEPLLTVEDANLHLGVAHLAALFRRYDGAVVPSLAAYNAGGTPVARWLRRYPNDPVTFVERIPYSETRGYVRTVLRNRAVYAALYGGGGAMP